MPLGRRLAAGVFAAALSSAPLAACGGGDGDQAAEPGATAVTTAPDASTTTNTTGGSTNTTVDRSADALLSPTPPPLLTTGEDFPAILDSMVFYMEWVTTHPNPALVENVYVKGGPAWQESVATVQSLVDQGLANRGDPATTSDVRVIDRIDTNRVVLYVVIAVPPYDYVDATGLVVAHDEGRPPSGWSYELARDGSNGQGRWYVVNRTDLGELPQ